MIHRITPQRHSHLVTLFPHSSGIQKWKHVKASLAIEFGSLTLGLVISSWLPSISPKGTLWTYSALPVHRVPHWVLEGLPHWVLEGLPILCTKCWWSRSPPGANSVELSLLKVGLSHSSFIYPQINSSVLTPFQESILLEMNPNLLISLTSTLRLKNNSHFLLTQWFPIILEICIFKTWDKSEYTQLYILF